VKPLTLW
jgi:hypothetical protein